LHNSSKSSLKISKLITSPFRLFIKLSSFLLVMKSLFEEISENTYETILPSIPLAPRINTLLK